MNFNKNMAGELPSSVNPEQQRVSQLKKQIDKFVATREYFSGIPPGLKRIAIDVAIDTITLDETYLHIKAGELDALAIENFFARSEKEANGGILDQDSKLRKKLANLGGRSVEENRRIANNQLRQTIASRQSRIYLAEKLGYKPGQWMEVVTREDFKAANDLAQQATREFGSILWLKETMKRCLGGF